MKQRSSTTLHTILISSSTPRKPFLLFTTYSWDYLLSILCTSRQSFDTDGYASPNQHRKILHLSFPSNMHCPKANLLPAKTITAQRPKSRLIPNCRKLNHGTKNLKRNAKRQSAITWKISAEKVIYRKGR